MILIAGGYQDPNIACLLQAASRKNVPYRVAFASMSKLTWDICNDDILQLDGQPVVGVKSFFQRFNSFGFDPQNSQIYTYYHAFYHALRAYSLHRGWAMLDQALEMNGYCKPLDLLMARQHGLKVPPTLVTDNKIPEGKLIFKRILGGAHTEQLTDAKQFGFGVGFAQELLPGSEYRIYVVGDKTFCFRMKSNSLDYRAKQDVEVSLVDSSELEDAPQKIKAMSHEKGLYFSASDLKQNSSGQLCFLEMNTAPMFVRFDQASNGELCNAMVDWLANPPGQF